MAKQIINLGTTPTGAGGDTSRSALVKCQANFDELYAADALGYKKANVLGVVSQSAGLPTGALIESGSNANGSYIKYADGTMVALQRLDTGLLGAAATGATSWTYPVAFAIAPFISTACGTAGVYGYSISVGLEDAPTSSGVSVSFKNSFVSSKYILLYLTAIGRWF